MNFKNLLNKKLFFSSVLLILFLLIGFVVIIQTKSSNRLTILFTHDLHSNLDEYAMPVDNDNVVITGGYARLYSAIQNELKDKEDDALVVDAGDFSMGTLFHTIRSTHSPELITMGLMGYDVTTFGNHEFEFGVRPLAQALLAAKKNNQGRLPVIVASNTVVDPQVTSLETFRKACVEYPVLPYVIIKRARLKIGLFGLMGKDAAIYAPEAKPVIFSDPIDAARKAVEILRHKEKVDMVICLSHSGTWKDKSISEDEILAKEVTGIDVIISGHTHSVLGAFIRVGNTYIVSSGCYSRYLGRLVLARNSDGSFQAQDYKIIPITSTLPEDPKISSLIDSYKKEIEKEYLSSFKYHYGQVLTETTFSLLEPDWGNCLPQPSCVTSGLGDLVTDAFVYAVRKAEGDNYRDISLALEGYGQIRVPIAKGPITVNDAMRLLALGAGLDDRAGAGLVAFWLTGDEIKKILELETTFAPIHYDMHLQIRGMRFSYDPKGEPLARIKEVEVESPYGSWQPLEGNRLYRVCTDWKMLLMRPSLEQLSGGKIIFIPKDETGKIIDDIKTTRVFVDAEKSLELKAWGALAMYLESFPQVPLEYRQAKINITKIDEVSLAQE